MPQLTVQKVAEMIFEYLRAGRVREAESLCRTVLAQLPGNVDALYLLGMVCCQTHRYAEAIPLLRQVLIQKPGHPESLDLLGQALQAAGQLGDAIASYRAALSTKPDLFSAQYGLAQSLHAQGQLDDAIAAFGHAIALMPQSAEAHLDLADALHDKGDLDAAVSSYRRAIALKGDYPEAHNNLANVLRAKGMFDEAIAAYRQAITLRPDFAEAHNNLANTLHESGRTEEAIAVYHQTVALKPDFAEAHANLGRALRDRGQIDEAVVACRRAIALKPDLAEAYDTLGNALKEAGRLDEALAAYRRAFTIRPGFHTAHSNYVYTLCFYPGYDGRALAEAQQEWARQHADPLKHDIRPHCNNRDPERRLRIGYVSPDFCRHVVGMNLLPLLANHDRARYEIFAYADVAVPDGLTEQLRANVDHWIPIVGRSDEQVAAQVRNDQIDILVDLTLHLARNRLLVFARKPAPVQATFAGYPGSTGLSTIDYRLSDPYLDPPGLNDSYYSEQTIRLPDSFWCYDPLDGREIPVNPLPALKTGTITFGCLNNFCKVNDRVLALWAQVLRQVSNSRLLLLAPEGAHRQQTLERLRHEGADSTRVDFVTPRPRQDYLRLYHQIDLGLDTFPYNGHTTSLDSFWMGVPVITLVGQTAVSRAGWCQLSNLKLTKLAAQTPEQFVQIAAAVASDLPRMEELRSGLRQRLETSPLMDAPRFARNIEAAYRQMWRGWCACIAT